MLVRILKGKPSPDSEEEKFIITLYQNGNAFAGIAANYLCFESMSYCSNPKIWDIDVMYIEAIELSLKFKPKEESKEEVEVYAVVFPLKLSCECTLP